MKVYLGVGHGMEPSGIFDPGATAPDGTREYDLAFAVTAAAHQALSRAGVDHFTETNAGAGHDPDYRGSVAAVIAGGYGFAVEIHFDSAAAPDKEFGIYVSSAGKKLADLIEARMRSVGIDTKPSYKDVRGLYFIEGTKCPALIVECGAVHPRSAELLRLAGEIIAGGICDYLGVAYRPDGPAVSLPAPQPSLNITNAVGFAYAPGGGRWKYAADGGVFAFEGAPFFGSMGGHPLNGPIVKLIPHGPGGYWLIGEDGGIFAFGDAPIHSPNAQLAKEYAAGDRHVVDGDEHAGTLLLMSNRAEDYGL